LLLSLTQCHIQYSPALIEQMKAKHSELRPEMTWLEMDIRKLEFVDDSFDIALDKVRLLHPPLIAQSFSSRRLISSG
jgi:ubiquinone/menaquinone biosynthesis C-methylase UbiE